MSRDYWMLVDDLCRCCHSEGTFQNLAGAFNFGEEGENMYCNLIRDTLDISIAPVAGALCAATFTICDACIARLRDAASFKRQVLRCEHKFNDLYGRNFIKLAESDYKVEVKEEEPEIDTEDAAELAPADDCLDDSFEIQHDDDDEQSNTKPIKQESKKKSKKTPQKAKPKSKPKKPPKKCGRPRKIKEIKEEAPADDKDNEHSSLRPVTSKLEQLLTRGGTLHDYLFFTVIEEGSASRYSCRNCHMKFVGENSIRHHVQTSHTNLNKNNISKVHNSIKLTQDVNNRLHYAENYICDMCRKEYSNKDCLRYHINFFHKLRKCPDCDLKFTMRDLRMHQQDAHGLQLPTCGICGYQNWIRFKVTNHQRKVHMNEKNASCEQCGMKFFNRMYLARHKIVHGADRKYECSFCHKKYPRLNTLRLHEKIHTKVKDKVCSVCGDGFVQKASLNYHMKKHHPESV